MKPELTTDNLCGEAHAFAEQESTHNESSIFGVTDGKRLGTYVEHKFQAYLHERHTYDKGSSAKGIDFPSLGVDMKVTSVRQPQSSCPYSSARQKIRGLGYSLLVFVYAKTDDAETQTGNLNILHTVFVDAHRTADYQTTTGIRKIIETEKSYRRIIGYDQLWILKAHLDDHQPVAEMRKAS